jgi:hypothetical protein
MRQRRDQHLLDVAMAYSVTVSVAAEMSGMVRVRWVSVAEGRIFE